MTYEEAIKYAKSTSFCCGCEVDMRFEGNEKVCDTCKHRLFFELAIKAFEKQAEIVHCKECKHWEKAPKPFSNENVCRLAGYFVGGNGFCIYGERCDE